jgi:hypothetical protein
MLKSGQEHCADRQVNVTVMFPNRVGFTTLPHGVKPLVQAFELEQRGLLQTKGLGSLSTYFVNGPKPESLSNQRPSL